MKFLLYSYIKQDSAQLDDSMIFRTALSTWFNGIPDSAQLDSMVFWTALNLIQWYSGQRTTWFNGILDCAQLDSMVFRTALNLIQWYSGQRSTWFNGIPDSAELDSMVFRTALNLIQRCPLEITKWTKNASISCSCSKENIPKSVDG